MENETGIERDWRPGNGDSLASGPSRRAVVARKARSAWRDLRTNPTDLRRALVRIDHYVVHGADPNLVPAPDPIPGAVLAKLTDDDLAALPASRPEVADQLACLRRRGFNNAYAVRLQGEVAHISWIITSELEYGYPIRNVKLRERESEITHCVTLPEYRGRGLYPFAIRGLCRIEAARGTKRLFMITNIKNKASQRGMEKAGLVRRGRIFRVYSPQLEGLTVTFRGHRWICAR